MPIVHRQSLGVVAMFAALSVAACKPEAAPDPRVVSRLVNVATVEAANGFDRQYTGVVAARVESVLAFRVQGKVIERLVDTGQVVKLGQPLMRIDATDYAHAVTVQIGDVAAARARWIQAASDERRYRGLTASGAVSQITYDQAKASADAAKALLSAAEAQEQVIRNQGDYAVLVADADGTIIDTLVEPGQVVAQGQAVMRLARSGAREAAVNLPETIRPQIGAEAKASLYGEAPTVPARLRQLSNSADVRTRTYEARYVLGGKGAEAPLGATVTVHIGDASDAVALQVPLGAVDDNGKGPGVWVLDMASMLISRRHVTVQRVGGESAILTDGVSIGDRIVAMGGPFLHEGERVRVAGQKAAMQ
jgi:RND family efflux transporter MFP subunit